MKFLILISILNLVLNCVSCNYQQSQYGSKSQYGNSAVYSTASSSSYSSRSASSSSSVTSSGCSKEQAKPNATFKKCPNPCPATCQNPQGVPFCYALCVPYGWECNPGYVLDNGNCILARDCPAQNVGCNGDINAVSSDCPSACQQTCDHPEPFEFCTLQCLKKGCVCKEGYVKDSNGLCILPQNCPGCNGDTNATTSNCPSACQQSCKHPEPFEACTLQCLPKGCVCNDGYVKDDNGICILPQDCPGCKGDNNATFSDCPSACQQSCERPEPDQTCTRQCLPKGCVCKKGYVKDSNGICILLEDCPVKTVGCNGDFNATNSQCPSACQRTCDKPEPAEFCTLQCLPEGCVCNDGYVKDSNGICILPQDCPAKIQGCNGDPNASLSGCPSACQQSCDHPEPFEACTLQCLPEGCVCNEGFVKDKNGICILPQDCPIKNVGCNGDLNATNSQCPSACQRTCDKPEPAKFCTLQCLPEGCVCNEGYVKDKNGICILPQDCPVKNVGCNGDLNATNSQCPSACQRTCDKPEPAKFCTLQCLPEGCVCNEGYVKDKNGICILPQDCPVKTIGCNGDLNATNSQCPSACQRTCDNPEPAKFCTLQCLPEGCVCNEGYVKDKNGICILPQDCPVKTIGCNGDLNATNSQCPSACQRTCDKPEPAKFCTLQCLPEGCVCNDGYVKDKNGICILPQNCPVKTIGCNGDLNATNSQCPSACQRSCDNPEPAKFCTLQCLPEGCVCNEGYVKDKNGICILPQDCPVKTIGCNGDLNATNSQCPSACQRTCDKPEPAKFCTLQCLPEGCVCNDGYVKDKNGICILPQDCPVKTLGCNGDLNATSSDCPSACQKTCDNPGPIDFCTKQCLAKGCVCNDGYVKDSNGICILPQDCPAKSLGCNGDVNATSKKCPNPCPPTCDVPGGTGLVCKKLCPQFGCECNEGFYLNDQGKCVQLQDCPGAKQCSANETFVFCYVGCPNNFCPSDDSRAIVACSPPIPCNSGCSCKSGYLRLNTEGNACVLSSDCPPINCTRQNEVYSPQPPACLFERCSDIGRDNVCDTRFKRSVPQCVCKPGFFRNDNDLCVPVEECPQSPLRCDVEEIAACKPCPPDTCDSIFTTYVCNNTVCEIGCNCIDGYLRNAKGVCVPNDECFLEPECEIPTECRATCSYPNPSNCPVMTSSDNEDGCKCKPGFVLTDVDGVCIEI